MLRFWFLAYLIANLCAPQAFAGQEASGLATPDNLSSSPSLELSISNSVSADVTIGQVAQGQSSAAQAQLTFQPFNAQSIHTIGTARAVWLRLDIRTPATVPPDGYVLRVPKPFIDRIEFYAQDTHGLWLMQAAGDKVAHSQWAMHSLDAQFMLYPKMAGVDRFYLRVQNETPLQFEVLLQRGKQNAAENHWAFMQSGIMLGWMAFIALLSALLAWLYRQSIYAWYALFVALAFLSIASHLGLGSYWFWPDADVWPSYSVLVFMVLSVVVQLQFCRLLFLSDRPGHWLHPAAISAMGVSMALLLGLVMSTHVMVVLVLYELALALCAIVMGVIVINAWRWGHWAAKYWVLAYLPVLVVVVLQIIENIGLQGFGGKFFYAPLYALIFETVVLMVVLHFNVKTQLTRTVRLSTLAATDPQTGFVNSQVFPQTLESMWDQALAENHDLSVAYVEVSYSIEHMSSRGKPDKLRSQQRVVRLLRTVAHERDVIAHVNGSLFALIMPHISMDQQLSDTLSRLVALGAMTDKDAVHDVPLRFHIVASSVGSFMGSADQVHEAIQSKLNQTDWGRKAIRFVRKRWSHTASSKPSDETLSAFWHRAVAEQAKSDARAI